MNSVKPSFLDSFAPTGILRVGINLGNPLLASLDESSGKPKGITVDIANHIASKLRLAIAFTCYQMAGATVEAVKAGDVDLVFLAVDPVRGADISYTPAYIQIEGAYMMKESSPITKNEEVDSIGNEIVVGKGSAYDLHLTREIKQATLIRSANSQTVVDDFMSGVGNVAAGVKQQLESDALRYDGLRLLPGRFMVINQAIGIPKARADYAITNTYLSAEIEALKSSGFIADAMLHHHIQGAKVAE